MVPLVNVALLVAFTGTLFNTLINPSWMYFGFTHCSYYIILALILVWAYSLIACWKENGNTRVFIRTHWKGFVFTFAVASVIFISTPKNFRVLSDETNVLSVAKSLTFNKLAENVTEGTWYYDAFWPLRSNVDKRPILFPLTVSLTDNLLGYRPENAFLLNYFILWAALFLLYLIIRSSLSTLWAFAGIVLLMSQPFMCLSATSTSFEFFNLLFILASFLSLRFFLSNPDHKSFLLLILNLLMLANIRYESCLFLIVVISVLLCAKYIRLDFFKKTPAYALMLFFLLPLIWQRILYLKTPDTDMPDGLWVKAFGFNNIANNAELFLEYIFNADGRRGFAGVTNIIGLMALVALTVIILTRKRTESKNNIILFTCSLISLLAFSGVLLFYDQARMTQHPMNGRLYMPLLLVLSVLPVYLVAKITRSIIHAPRLFLTGALAVFIFYHPIAMEDRLTSNLMIIRDFRYVVDFLKKTGDKNALVICSRPGQLVVYNYGAISFETANHDKNIVMEQLRNDLFSEVYVVQEILYKTKSAAPNDALDPIYPLQAVRELQSDSSYYLRISKVIK